MPRAGEGLAVLGMTQQDVQELVAQQRLDLGIGAAVLADELEVDEEPRALLAGHRQRRHPGSEFDAEDAQHGADGERVLFDQLAEDGAEAALVHA